MWSCSLNTTHSLWQTDKREVMGRVQGVEKCKRNGEEVRVVQRWPLSCKAGDEVWTQAGYLVTARGLCSSIRTSVHGGRIFCIVCIFSFFYFVTLCLEEAEMLRKHLLLLNWALSFFAVLLSCCSHLSCLCLFYCAHPHLDDEPAREGGLWSRFATWPTLFRLESWLCLYFELSVRCRHTGAFVLLAKTKTSSTGGVLLNHTDMLQHVQAHIGLHKWEGKTTNIYEYRCHNACFWLRKFIFKTFATILEDYDKRHFLCSHI